MSSLIRRIQKNIAKSQGFKRHRDGHIVDSDGTSVGDFWPKVKAPTRVIE